MISDTTLKYIQWYMRGGERLKISLFVWNKSTGEFGMTKSKLTWSIVLTIVAYLLLQSAFEASQIYRLAGDPTEPLADYMKLLSQSLSRFLCCMVTIDVCFYGKNKAAFLNQIILLNKRFKTVEGCGKEKDTVKLWARIILYVCYIHPATVASTFIQERNQSRYWHHLVIPESVLPFTLPFFGVLEYVITALTAHPGLLYLYLMTIYFRSSSAWLGLVMKMGKSRGEEWKTDRLAMFRTLQVYNQIYNNRMAVVWTYQMASIFVIQTLCTVISLREAFAMPFPGNCMFFVGASSSMLFTTKIYLSTAASSVKSQELAADFKRSKDKYKKCVGASMKPLYVEARPFFVMTKTTAFSFEHEVADKTISILVTT